MMHGPEKSDPAIVAGKPAEGDVVGRIYKANAAPVGMPWMDARLRGD
jgi:hypothetical protein